jgi:hypothetical protein
MTAEEPQTRSKDGGHMKLTGLNFLLENKFLSVGISIIDYGNIKEMFI